jgi:hypothetical protein
VALLILSACSARPLPIEIAAGSAPDLGAPTDLALPVAPSDQSSLPDLARPRDLAPAPDLAPPPVVFASTTLAQLTRPVLSADFDRDGIDDAYLFGGLVCWGDRAQPLADCLLVLGQNVGNVGDVDGDGFPDLLNAGGTGFTVERSLGNRRFGAYEFHDAGAIGTTTVAAGAFNHDGWPDVVMGGWWPSTRHGYGIVLGGPGGFGGPRVAPIDHGESIPIVRDFDGDGHLDFLDVDLDVETSGRVTVYRGDGAGGFAAAPASTFNGARAFTVGDVDGDGVLDFVYAWSAGPRGPPEGSVGVMHGRGDGTFAPPILYDDGISPWFVVVGDFNSDGRLDIATGSAEGAQGDPMPLHVLRGAAGGTLLPPQRFATGTSGVWLMTTGDYDGDGRTDLLISTYDWKTGQLGADDLLLAR